MIRSIYIVLLLCFATSLSAQVQSKWFVVGDVTNAINQGGGEYAISTTVNTDQSGNGYSGSDVMAGDRIITATGRNYSITSVTTSGATSMTLVVQNLEATPISPSGRILLYSYSASDPYVPVGAINFTGISAAFSAIITNHNFESIPASSGSGSVSTDATMTGDGTLGSPLALVPANIATSTLNNDAGFLTTEVDADATNELNVFTRPADQNAVTGTNAGGTFSVIGDYHNDEIEVVGGASSVTLPAAPVLTATDVYFTRNGVVYKASATDGAEYFFLSGTTLQPSTGEAPLEDAEKIGYHFPK